MGEWSLGSPRARLTFSFSSCSPKSYGPHVASMAGVPRDCVERAIAISAKFEERTRQHEYKKRSNQAIPLDMQADAAFRTLLCLGSCRRLTAMRCSDEDGGPVQGRVQRVHARNTSHNAQEDSAGSGHDFCRHGSRLRA